MSSQNKMLKQDILNVLSKQISGGGEVGMYPDANVPKTFFGLGGNAWTDHVKAFKLKNPNMTHKDALTEARKTYDKPLAKSSSAKIRALATSQSQIDKNLEALKRRKKERADKDEKIKDYLAGEDDFLDMINKRDGKKPAKKAPKKAPKKSAPKKSAGRTPKQSGTSIDGIKWKRDQVFKYTPSEGGFITYILIKNGKVETKNGYPPKIETRKYDPSYSKSSGIDKFYDTNIRTYSDINLDSSTSYTMEDKKNMEEFVKFANRMATKKSAKKPARADVEEGYVPTPERGGLQRATKAEIAEANKPSKKTTNKAKVIAEEVIDYHSDILYNNLPISKSSFKTKKKYDEAIKFLKKYSITMPTDTGGADAPSQRVQQALDLHENPIEPVELPKKIKAKIEKATTIKELEQIKKDHGTKPKNTPQYQKLLDRTKARKSKKQAKTAPKKSADKPKKPLSAYTQFVKDFSAKNKNLGKDRFKIISEEWKRVKKNPAKAPKKEKQRIDPLHQVSKDDAKKSRKVKKPAKKDVGSFITTASFDKPGTRTSARITLYFDKDEGFDAFYDGKTPRFYYGKKLQSNEIISGFAWAQRGGYELALPLIKKDWIDSISAPSTKPTHTHPDGTIMTGKKHTKDSKIIKPAKKQAKKSADKPKRPLTAYTQFVKDFSARNKNLGKDRFKIISEEWKRVKNNQPPLPPRIPRPDDDEIVPHQVDTDSEDEEDAVELEGTLPPVRQSLLDPGNTEFIKSQLPNKVQNNILADVFDSFDNFNRELESVANSNMTKTFKQGEFNKIMDRAFEFNEKILTTLNKSLDPVSRKRAEDAFNHTQLAFTEGYKDLKSGHDVVEFDDYEDDQVIQSIIDGELIVPVDAIDQYQAIREEDARRQEEEREPPITQSVNLHSKDNLPVELQVEFEEFSDVDEDALDFVYDDTATEYDLGYDEKIQSDLLERERKAQEIKERFEDIYYEQIDAMDRESEKEGKLQKAIDKIRDRKEQYARNARIADDLSSEGTLPVGFDEDDLDEILDEVNSNTEYYDSDEEFRDIFGEYNFDDDDVLEILDEKEDNTLQYERKPTLYPYNVLTDENSIQPPTLEQTAQLPRIVSKKTPKKITELSGQPSAPAVRTTLDIPIKPKRKRPLNLRLYQEFLKLMRKNDPSLSRADITALWKTNKEAYIDMLMDVVDLSGGNLQNEEHYFNAFRNIGGVMLGGSCCDCSGGAMSGPGNKYYRMAHPPQKFDRSVYDKVNNPYGVGKTHADEQPRLPTPSAPTRTPSKNYEDDYIDMEDLSDPRAWGKTFENIAKGTYEGLKTVYKILSPLSWLP